MKSVATLFAVTFLLSRPIWADKALLTLPSPSALDTSSIYLVEVRSHTPQSSPQDVTQHGLAVMSVKETFAGPPVGEITSVYQFSKGLPANSYQILETPWPDLDTLQGSHIYICLYANEPSVTSGPSSRSTGAVISLTEVTEVKDDTLDMFRQVVRIRDALTADDQMTLIQAVFTARTSAFVREYAVHLACTKISQERPEQVLALLNEYHSEIEQIAHTDALMVLPKFLKEATLKPESRRQVVHLLAEFAISGRKDQEIQALASAVQLPNAPSSKETLTEAELGQIRDVLTKLPAATSRPQVSSRDIVLNWVSNWAQSKTLNRPSQ